MNNSVICTEFSKVKKNDSSIIQCHLMNVLRLLIGIYFSIQY